MIPGRGRGKGYPRIGKAGFNYCRCPNCGYTEKHSRFVPCNKIKCPKCGTYMIGY